ncbi:fatty acid alpha-hydroxylase [Apophysomyces sp. BC1034]|nr:fatty acid alpha-hydroxylase [Apophysomyces sp. BC1015]KAG0175874.1 fatty acid alpha-hydroxylase [Apophysomyces sp. BC1021]KAG0186234.1 fatty acid alpha-hydroxylase [Apophysomyces sp. BC1034]
MALFTLTQVQEHNSVDSCWMVYKGKVYDVTEFVRDHPGGEEILLQFAGADVTNVLDDETYHTHSDAACDLLEEYLLGDLVDDQTAVEASIPTKKKPVVARDEAFLDLRKPLFGQLWNATYSKSFYLEQVHRPRFVPFYVPYFSDPTLDLLSRTSWYVVPLIWLPFVSYQLWASVSVPMATKEVALQGFAAGVMFWTLLEYWLHRILFHFDDWLPDHPAALFIHFTLHGIHHHMPMDRLRLVMPPALTILLGTPVIQLAHWAFAPAFAYAFVAGAFFGYVCYDMIHYYLHHAQVIEVYFKEMKRYHLAHHYKDYETAFGITSKLWDYIFGTPLSLDMKVVGK